MGGSGGKGGDTARSIGFQWTPEGMETLFIKSKVLVDSRSAGIEFPISGGWFDIHDLDGLRDLANQLKQLGYTGMHLIHPSHVPVVNDVFTPGPEQIAHWKGLLKAMEKQRQAGSAVVTYAGDMVDIAPRGNRPDHAGDGTPVGYQHRGSNRLTVATSKGAGATNVLVFRVPHLVAEGNDGGRHSNWSPMLRSIPPTWPVLTLPFTNGDIPHRRQPQSW